MNEIYRSFRRLPKGKEAYIQPIIEENKVHYEVKYGTNAPEAPKTGRGQFKCFCCGEPVKSEHIKTEGRAKRIGAQMMAVVAMAKIMGLQIQNFKTLRGDWNGFL